MTRKQHKTGRTKPYPIGHRQLDIIDSLGSLERARGSAIAADIGTPYKQVWAALVMLRRRGLVGRTDRFWRLTPHGRETLQRCIAAGRTPGVPMTVSS